MWPFSRARNTRRHGPGLRLRLREHLLKPRRLGSDGRRPGELWLRGLRSVAVSPVPTADRPTAPWRATPFTGPEKGGLKKRQGDIEDN